MDIPVPFQSIKVRQPKLQKCWIKTNQSMVVFDYFWLFLIIFDYFWLFLIIFDYFIGTRDDIAFMNCRSYIFINLKFDEKNPLQNSNHKYVI